MSEPNYIRHISENLSFFVLEYVNILQSVLKISLLQIIYGLKHCVFSVKLPRFSAFSWNALESLEFMVSQFLRFSWVPFPHELHVDFILRFWQEINVKDIRWPSRSFVTQNSKHNVESKKKYSFGNSVMAIININLESKKIG